MKAYEQYLKDKALLTEKGLYDPSFEHSACGVGMVAEIEKGPSRRVVVSAIEALSALWHRGAVDADGKTGDGAGVLLEIPQKFFEKKIEEMGYENEDHRLAVGMIFLPRNNIFAQEQCRTVVESELHRSGLKLFGWRHVPVGLECIGEKANATRPEVEQIIVGVPKEVPAEEIEARLFKARKKIENRVRRRSINEFYICSLSSQTIIYKGLFLASQLSIFYPDLQDEDFVSRYALYHQRYSTNTFPEWSLAQPFRCLAHNGEINTLRSNINWLRVQKESMAGHSFTDKSFAKSFEGSSEGLIDDDDWLNPIVPKESSDSQAMDAVFELLVRSGRNAPTAKSIMIPEAWRKNKKLPEGLAEFYTYCNALMKPWDGPAAIVANDGEWVVAGLDRSGLRPLRYTRTFDGLIVVGSETGMVKFNEADVAEKGRLNPGQMIAINLRQNKFFIDREIKDYLANQRNYKDFVTRFENFESNSKVFEDYTQPTAPEKMFLFGYTLEQLETVLFTMASTGGEPIGSMGDDIPWAVLTDNYRPLHHFFRQNFAQVTNPPLDPIREERVMSLTTRIGNLVNVLEESPLKNKVLVLNSPLISNSAFEDLKKEFVDKTYTIKNTYYPANTSLEKCLDSIRLEAEQAVLDGFEHLVISDIDANFENIPAPMVLAVAGIHNHLIYKKIRSKVTLSVKSAAVFDVHHLALLIGVGATTVNPYYAEQIVYDFHQEGRFEGQTLEQSIDNFYKAFDKGLLKIMSKFGISVVSAYRGGYHFEAIGLSRSIVQEFFPDMPARISGLTLSRLEKRFKKYLETYDEKIPVGGLYKLRLSADNEGEGQAPARHRWEAQRIHLLQTAVTRDSYTLFRKYLELERSGAPYNLRDLFEIEGCESNQVGEASSTELGGFSGVSGAMASESSTSISIPAEVESISSIRTRFVSPGMSHGALSTEAHETLAIALNRMGGKSVSGEGGENPERRKPRPNGDNANSAVKQIASGRFGVTADYLNSCTEIEIKMAQGAKPGEGGQLPGFKVTPEIATLRFTVEGTTLISPPPHHDIYSIEDLAQLIYDLKQINDRARICVKLVAKSGIGTIAAGVAKAGADIISVSGHNGGTGASAQSSISHAGLPWELGLSEVHQILTLNRLRSRMTLRVDGGISTGRDVIVGALLGAEEFGIGTASLVAMGCLLVRQCQSNVCPVGICTQKPELRKLFEGTPEKVINLYNFISEDVREHLSRMGFSRLQEIIGRTDLIKTNSDRFSLDLNPMLIKFESEDLPEGRGIRNAVPPTLDDRILKDARPFFERKERMELAYGIENTHRSVGTKLSGQIVRTFGDEVNSLMPGQLTLNLRGSGGQSLGAFGVKGLRIVLSGDSNDYVGKGLCGAEIFIKPFASSKLRSDENTIIGNTVLYGATSGKLYAAGQAGERFAVRNSGALAVVEGCGANGCEYMTGGQVVILGEVGENFGAGMTGGKAYIFDPQNSLDEYLNESAPIPCELESIESEWLRETLVDFSEKTGSVRAREILGGWDDLKMKFRALGD